MGHMVPQHEICWNGRRKATELDKIENPRAKKREGFAYIIKSIHWSRFHDCYVWIYAGKGYTGNRPRPEHLYATEAEARASIAKREALEAKRVAKDPMRKPRRYDVATYCISTAYGNAGSYETAKLFNLWNDVSARAEEAGWTAERPDSDLAVQVGDKIFRHFRAQGIDFLIYAEPGGRFNCVARAHARREAGGWTPYVGIDRVGDPSPTPAKAVAAALDAEVARLRR